MATPEQEIERGQGGDPTSPPLPQGAATEVEEAEVAPEELDEGLLLEDDEDMSDIEFADEEDEEDLAAPKDDVSQYLFAPGTGIEPSLTGNPRRAGPVPRSVVRRIPILGAAASSPDAPPMIRALYRLIVDVARQDQDV